MKSKYAGWLILDRKSGLLVPWDGTPVDDYPEPTKELVDLMSGNGDLEFIEALPNTPTVKMENPLNRAEEIGDDIAVAIDILKEAQHYVPKADVDGKEGIADLIDFAVQVQDYFYDKAEKNK